MVGGFWFGGAVPSFDDVPAKRGNASVTAIEKDDGHAVLALVRVFSHPRAKTPCTCQRKSIKSIQVMIGKRTQTYLFYDYVSMATN